MCIRDSIDTDTETDTHNDADTDTDNDNDTDSDTDNDTDKDNDNYNLPFYQKKQPVKPDSRYQLLPQTKRIRKTIPINVRMPTTLQRTTLTTTMITILKTISTTAT